MKPYEVVTTTSSIGSSIEGSVWSLHKVLTRKEDGGGKSPGAPPLLVAVDSCTAAVVAVSIGSM